MKRVLIILLAIFVLMGFIGWMAMERSNDTLARTQYAEVVK